MADEEGELAPEPKWTTAPDGGAAAPSGAAPAPAPAQATQGPAAPSAPPPPMAPQGPVALAGPPPQVAPAPAGPAMAPGQAHDFAHFAARVGRELVRVTPFFRLAGILILAGCLVLVAENALIFTRTVAVVQDAQGLLDAGNNTSAQDTARLLASTSDFFATLSLATQLDLFGYSLLGAGALLMGVGSLGIESRSRFDGSTRRPSKAILVMGALSGTCAMLWVFYTMQWRTQLTGMATGDWSFAPAMFNVEQYVQQGGVPQQVRGFLDSFEGVLIGWMTAAVVQVPAAGFFLGASWMIKRETGVRLGGASWLVFSITATVGTLFFLLAMMGVVQAVRSAVSDPQSAQGVMQQIGIQLAIGAVVKLLVIPFYAIVSFALLALAGLRLLKIKQGRVVMGDGDLKAVLATPSLPAPPAAGEPVFGPPGTPGAIPPPPPPPVLTPLPAPPGADVVVTIGAPPPRDEPKK